MKFRAVTLLCGPGAVFRFATKIGCWSWPFWCSGADSSRGDHARVSSMAALIAWVYCSITPAPVSPPPSCLPLGADLFLLAKWHRCSVHDSEHLTSLRGGRIGPSTRLHTKAPRDRRQNLWTNHSEVGTAPASISLGIFPPQLGKRPCSICGTGHVVGQIQKWTPQSQEARAYEAS